LVAALLSKNGGSAKIVELVLSGRLHSFYTDETVDELKDVLQRPKFGLERELRDHFVQLLTEASFPVEPLAEFVVVKCRDPKDDKFLALAAQVEADYLVSLDDDLLDLAAQGRTTIATPSDFLLRLRKRQLRQK
jgi:putative PIN family toxin of toxin-antitoxin system